MKTLILQLSCLSLFVRGNEFINALKRATLTLEATWEPARAGGEFVTSFDGIVDLQTAPNASFSFSNDAKLVGRQRCPIGSSNCGTGCCRAGTTCVPNGCCPLGEQACGSNGCYDPVMEVCCGSSGQYCKRGYTCQQNGCCPNGESQCGNKGCYNPQTSICCGETGTYCPKTHDCVADGCCPKGQARCGARGCYDPKTSICCGSSGMNCLRSETCVASGTKCCPQGQSMCGNEKCYNPAIAKCCTSGGLSWVCPRTGSCCDDAKSCYFPDWERCCQDGACPAETSCCGSECCVRGAICGRDKQCTYTATTTRKTVTRTRTCTTPTLAQPQTTTRTIPFVYDPNRRARLSGTRNKIPHTNQAIMWNMCRGINKHNGGLGGNKLTLTHGGECFQKFNRDKMCTEDDVSWCRAAINEFINEVYGGNPPPSVQQAIEAAGNMQCDEFPFATSVEGGDLIKGLRICVPADDQSFQGSSMSKFFGKNKRNRILEGEKYTIEIKGWDCDKQAPDASIVKRENVLAKRLAFDKDGVDFDGEEMYRGFDPEFPNMNLMAMPLGDLNAGEYTVNLNVTNGVLNLTLIDYNGMEFDFSTPSGRGVQFKLDEYHAGVSLQGVTYDDNVEVVYHATAVSTVPASTSSTATRGGSASISTLSATGTSSQKSAAAREGLSVYMVLTCAAFIFLLL